jgi:WD40 repeat protein
MENEQNYSFDVPNDDCYKISPNLDQIALTNKDHPEELAVYSLKTGDIVAMFNWVPEWHWNCGFDWESAQKLVVWTELPPNNTTTYEILLTDKSISGPNGYRIPALPNFDPAVADYLVSPDGREYVYSYCESVDQQFTPSQCRNWQGFIIYNVEQQNILTTLDDSLPPSSKPLALSLFFAWSPSGRYLAYLGSATLLHIYDTQQHVLLNTGFISDYPKSFEGQPLGIIWSPDESRVALGLSTIDSTSFQETKGIGIVDINEERFTFVNINEENWPNHSNAWVWSPDNQNILVVRPDKKLVQINLLGNVQFIADDVDQIYSWYGASTP